MSDTPLSVPESMPTGIMYDAETQTLYLNGVTIVTNGDVCFDGSQIKNCDGIVSSGTVDLSRAEVVLLPPS